MTERTTWTFVGFAAILVVASAAIPALVDARPAREVPAPTVEGNLSGANADGWAEAPAAEVPLSAAPSGLPNAESVNTRSVEVQAARADGDVFVRLQWQDTEASRNASNPNAFLDGAAVQIPVDTSEQPAIAMGSQSNLVNVWYWTADGDTEELLAGGQGSTTAFENETVRTWASYDDGEDTWSVVFNREAEPDGDNRTAITGEDDLDVAFAVWDGANDERSGQKAVSEWYYLPVGPDDGGTPFASILWALAGIAIVAVVVLTAQGIRRARSEGDGRL